MEGLDPQLYEGPAVVLQPFVDPASRTWWVGLLCALGIAAVAPRLGIGPSMRRTAALFVHPSSRLDVQLLASRQLLVALGVLPAIGGGLWLATHLVRWLDAALGVPELAPPPVGVTGLYTVATFVAWDLSRYVLHRMMHTVPALWALHQVHHSASVLTPLTFHRIHPLEAALYGLRGALVTGGIAGLFFWGFRGSATTATVLGVHAVGLLLNVTTGNLRHSHVWLGFGPLEGWLISPAQHQLHHAMPAGGVRGEDAGRCNYGTWLSVWDRLGGSLVRSGAVPPTAFGLAAPNHDNDLLSAWVRPVIHAACALRRLAVGLPVVWVLSPGPARGVLRMGGRGAKTRSGKTRSGRRAPSARPGAALADDGAVVSHPDPPKCGGGSCARRTRSPPGR